MSHLFLDLADRLFPWDRAHAKNIEQDMFDQLHCITDEHRLGNISKATMQEDLNRLGEDYVKRLANFLGGIEYQESVWCTNHDTECPVSPRDGLRNAYDNVRMAEWTETAGCTCVAWTYGMHSKNVSGWCHESTLTQLIWLFSTKFYEPDRVVLECVPKMPIMVIKEYMENNDGDSPKSVCARPFTRTEEDGTQSRQYISQTEVFDVTDLGVPSSRRRLYAHCFLAPFVKQAPSMHFSSMFFRKLRLGAECYLVHPPHT